MGNSEINEIVEYLKRGNLEERDRIDAIRGLGETGDKEAYGILIRMLEKFDKLSWKERNAVAIALGYLGFDEGVPYLMRVVKNPDYNGYSGSFLYALTIKPMDCKGYFLDIIELLCTGDLEIRESAIVLIEKFHKSINVDILKRGLELLSTNKILVECQGERNEKYGALGYIEYAQDLLERSMRYL